MKKFENLLTEITTWNGTFDKLVKHFDSDDYYLMLTEGQWHGTEEYAEEFYQEGDWTSLLHTFIAVWLMDYIDLGIAADTPNLFRLWHESTV